MYHIWAAKRSHVFPLSHSPISSMYWHPQLLRPYVNRLPLPPPHASKIRIAGRSPSVWSTAYLSGQRVSGMSLTADHTGIISEELAYAAVLAAVDQDLKLIEQLVKDVRNAALANERGGSDEWLYGRLGACVCSD